MTAAQLGRPTSPASGRPGRCFPHCAVVGTDHHEAPASRVLPDGVLLLLQGGGSSSAHRESSPATNSEEAGTALWGGGGEESGRLGRLSTFNKEN